jgi:hypothetical protein
MKLVTAASGALTATVPSTLTKWLTSVVDHGFGIGRQEALQRAVSVSAASYGCERRTGVTDVYQAVIYPAR